MKQSWTERKIRELSRTHGAMPLASIMGAVQDAAGDDDALARILGDREEKPIDSNGECQRQLRLLHQDMDERFAHRMRDIGALADEINQLAIVMEEIARETVWTVAKKAEARQRLLKIREHVAPLIIDNPEPQLEEFTILHHVRAGGLDEALAAADMHAQFMRRSGLDVEVANTKVTAGVKELRP